MEQFTSAPIATNATVQHMPPWGQLGLLATFACVAIVLIAVVYLVAERLKVGRMVRLVISVVLAGGASGVADWYASQIDLSSVSHGTQVAHWCVLAPLVMIPVAIVRTLVGKK